MHRNQAASNYKTIQEMKNRDPFIRKGTLYKTSELDAAKFRGFLFFSTLLKIVGQVSYRVEKRLRPVRR